MISIQGFKSYKDQIITDEFTPKHNVIVGRNGSGKSNFFSAVRFVLSDAYNNMGREERQALLYEGSGSTTMSAFVEIVFDNSDQRFPTGKDETVIRRTVGLKKDEYSLDKKSCTKADVMSLLESAGFSRSNPYYIVPQGRITSLTHAKDAERLELLKEVAGTKIYDNRREESFKILAETNAKQEKIIELLTSIDEKLEDLEKEQEDLKKFQDLDKERRCLGYAIYTSEQNEVTDQLEETVRDYQICLTQTNGLETELTDIEKGLQDFKKLEDSERQKNQASIAERQYLVQELAGAVSKRIQLEALKVENENEFGGQQEIESSKRKLNKALDQRNKTKARLDESDKALKDLHQTHEKIKIDLMNSEARYNELTRKSGRNSEFKTVEDRNSWIDSRIKKLQDKSLNLKNTLSDLNSENFELENKFKECGNLISDYTREMESCKSILSKAKNESQSIIQSRNDLVDSRKELWRAEARLEAELKDIKNKESELGRSLMLSVERSVSLGLQALPEIVNQLGIQDKVYGPLYQLFDIEEDYRLAAEAVSGSSIFQVVVEDDETAALIIQQLQKIKSGRLTFMPLSKLNTQIINYPNTEDSIPIINKLTFDEKFTPAIQQVFGKSILCSTLEVAAGYARTHGLISVTLDGDRTDYSGVFSGGLISSSKSRMEMALNYKKVLQKANKESLRLESLKSEIKSISAQINNTNTELQALSSNTNESIDKKLILKNKMAETSKDIEKVEAEISLNKVAVNDTENRVSSIEAEIVSLSSEKSSELASSLLPQEQIELENLSSQITLLQQESVNIATNISEKTENKNQLKNLLIELLEPRVEQFTSIVDSLNRTYDLKTKEGTYLNLFSELERAISHEKKIKDSLSVIDKDLENYRNTLNKITLDCDNYLSQRDKTLRQLNSLLKKSEELVSRRQLLNKRLEDCTSNIRMLGVLPDEAFDKYIDIEHNQLLRKLKKTNDKLRDYGHVNKKAVDQYNSFSRQRDDLVSREQELEASYESIQSLISALDQRKEEAIERTFKSVAKNFSEVFEALVPAGKGDLVMQKGLVSTHKDSQSKKFRRSQNQKGRKNQIDSSGDVEMGTGQKNDEAASEYVGVSIKVSFNSKDDEGLRMQQLSGGQKSLVSLALIFAIQKCDPAPFYLFDEIDANLDAVYRTSVAKHELVGSLPQADDDQIAL
ncbi:hypothetical protein BB561_003892 [Smittium simulii]|uniref:Structural maintenance of chromosomes protein n=1 Tax=Smittium simulii TaxID=133385 RepID=A0A2T9YJ15_9FUNG|nr:hypothetical protein BB561_003892 [Smittium simulii]